MNIDLSNWNKPHMLAPIKRVLVRKNNVYLKIEQDYVQTEHEEIINASEILNGYYEIDDVWNEYNTQQVNYIKHSKYKNIFLTDGDRKLIMSSNSSRNFKEKFLNHKRKYNVSLTLYHETNTKNLEDFLVDTIP